MIIGLTKSFPPDQTEHDIPDVVTARALITARRPDVLTLLKRRRAVYHDFYGPAAQNYLERAESAVLLSLARFGLRHGSFGADFHDYHNEDHALEILDRRIGRVLGQEGVEALPGRDWLALSLFATCHDLRQREPFDFDNGIGNNEAASISETFRILELSGFGQDEDEDLYVALEVMIAGSTFDARPIPPDPYNTALAVATGGPLAPKLTGELDRVRPGWRDDAKLVRAFNLALLASDLDTANVGERFVDFAASAARLASEREMRSDRELDDPASGPPVLGFLTKGQERYFFELHRFCSELGKAVFAQGKETNAPRVRELSGELQTRFGAKPVGSYCGEEVLKTHLTLAEEMAEAR